MDLLHFKEGFFERIWGGQRLRQLYGMDAPADQPIGEAWLIADHDVHESVVDEGPLEGITLRALLERDAEAILGSRAQLTVHGRFPLLLKVLDSNDHLSVQVHPDNECAKSLNEPDVGKTEMWHVLHADPGSELICGLDTTVAADTLAGAVHDGTLEDLMTRFEVHPGDSVFVSAGTVHAIGGGIVLAEIQQNSDLTYRLYDWGRVQADGTPRELHVEKAMNAIHFGSPSGGKAEPLAYQLGDCRCEVLAACEYFAAELVHIEGAYCRLVEGQSFHIALCIKGEITVSAGDAARPLRPAEAVLIPGSQARYEADGAGQLLDYYVPDLAKDLADPLQQAGHPADAIQRLIGA